MQLVNISQIWRCLKIGTFKLILIFHNANSIYIVLDNARVHRNAKIKHLHSLWERRDLFYIPPYSPHLNIVKTLWRVMKSKWLKPQDYACADTLFYVTNRALATIGRELNINYHYCPTKIIGKKRATTLEGFAQWCNFVVLPIK